MLEAVYSTVYLSDRIARILEFTINNAKYIENIKLMYLCEIAYKPILDLGASVRRIQQERTLNRTSFSVPNFVNFFIVPLLFNL